MSQTFHQLSAKFGSGLYCLICGDKNDTSIQQILNLSPVLKQCVQSPTRLNPARILDVCITDLSSFYQTPIVVDPLQVDIDKTGSNSDHKMVTMTPIGSLNDKKNIVKKKVQFRPLNEQGFQEMGHLLEHFEWDGILSIESADKQMEVFQNELFRMFNESFPEKTVTFLDDSQPFYSKKLLLLKEKKKREYNKNRRSTKFLSLHNSYRDELIKAMRVVRHHTSAVHRQIHEACLIWQRAREKRVTVLNSKSMFNRCSLTRLVLEDSNSEAQNDTFVRRDLTVDQRQGGESSASGPSISNSSVINASVVGKTGFRKRKQTDGQETVADIRIFLKRVKDRDKNEE